jgi:hypothetical protein
MNKSTLSIFAVVCTSVVGCAAPDQEPTESESTIESTSLKLTVEECATQQDTCFRKNPFFGLFTCPLQYTQCTAGAEDGIPVRVASAISDLADCNKEAADCIAENIGGAAGCAAARAQCVADVVDVKLPTIVEGTAECIDNTVECVDAAKEVESLADCATDLNSCAVEQVVDSLPKPVTDAIKGANECRIDFEECLAGVESTGAAGAAAIAECTGDNTKCVAGILGVTLPDVPVEDVAECAADAADCALDVETPEDVVECATNLSTCAGEVIEDIEDVPEELTCEQKWTACVAKSPFGIFTCGIELAGCQD